MEVLCGRPCIKGAVSYDYDGHRCREGRDCGNYCCGSSGFGQRFFCGSEVRKLLKSSTKIDGIGISNPNIEHHFDFSD